MTSHSDFATLRRLLLIANPIRQFSAEKLLDRFLHVGVILAGLLCVTPSFSEDYTVYEGASWTGEPLGYHLSLATACQLSIARRNPLIPYNTCVFTSAVGGFCRGNCTRSGNNVAVSTYNTIAFTDNYSVSEDEPVASCHSDQTNPCDVVTGRKTQKEPDYASGLLEFARYYDSGSADPGIAIGVRWRHSYDARIDNLGQLSKDAGAILATVAPPPSTSRSSDYATRSDACLSGWGDIKATYRGGSFASASAVFTAEGNCEVVQGGNSVGVLPVRSQSGTGWLFASSGAANGSFWGSTTAPIHTVSRPNGAYYTFVEASPGVFEEASGLPVRLQLSGTDFLFISETNVVDRFSSGRFVERTDTHGRSVTLDYDNSGRLHTVSDDDGNSLVFTYTANGQIETLTHPAGQLYYAYDSNHNLVSVTREDTAVREYHYENTSFPHHLTGITDELGNRYSTWAYDSAGRAVSSEHAGSADKVTLDYYAGYTEVTDASGGIRRYNIGNSGQRRVVTSVTGDKCVDCPGSGVKSRTYDGNGYLDEVTDWNGNITDYDHDARGLEVQRIEAKGTPQQRTITTTWHAELRLPLQIVEPERITHFTYTTTGALLSRQVLPNPGAP